MFHKFNMFLISSLIIWIIVMFDLVWGQLIRPIYVYEGLIRDIHTYFNNTCIILLHSNPNPIETQGEKQTEKWKILFTRIDFSLTESCYFAGLMEADRLLHLQKYLSSTLHIHTAIMDFHMLIMRVST